MVDCGAGHVEVKVAEVLAAPRSYRFALAFVQKRTSHVVRPSVHLPFLLQSLLVHPVADYSRPAASLEGTRRDENARLTAVDRLAPPPLREAVHLAEDHAVPCSVAAAQWGGGGAHAGQASRAGGDLARSMQRCTGRPRAERDQEGERTEPCRARL